MATSQSLPPPPPYVSAVNFFYAYTPGGKRLFGVLWGVLALAVGVLLYYLQSPYGALIRYATEGAVFSEVLPIEQMTEGPLTEELLFPVFSSWPRFFAVSQPVPLHLVLFFGICQALGWSAVLASTSRMKGIWPYLVYGFLILHLSFTDFSGLWGLGKWPSLLLVAGVSAVFVVPAFLFQQRRWIRSLPVQFVLYVLLWCVFYGLASVKGGVPGLHRVVTFPLPGLILPWLFLLLHTSKDGVNLLLLITLNHPSPATRVRRRGVVALLVLFCLCTAFLAWRTVTYQLDQSTASLRPLYLLGLLVLATPFTSQNYFHQIRETLTSNLALTTLLLGTGLLGMGTLAFCAAVGDRLLLLRAEWIFGLQLAVVSGVYTAYFLGHFWRLLKERYPLFYVAMEPPYPTSVRFLVVWFVSLSVFVFFEGSKNWASIKLTVGARLNQQGDNALLRGEPAEASVYYQGARTLSRVDPKASFQLATLLEASPEGNPADIVELYRQAEGILPWPAARLNGARYLLQAQLDTLGSITFLLRQPPELRTPEVLHTAAALYRLNGATDSSLAFQKAALAADPSSALLCAALAQEYWQLGHTEAANSLFAHARKLPLQMEAAQEMLTFLTFSLRRPKEDLPPVSLPVSNRLSSSQRFTLAVGAYALRDTARFWQLHPEEPELRERSDFVLLGMLGDFLTDSLELAASRQRLFQLGESPFTGISSRTLAYGLFLAGMPEMAAHYFFLSDSSGWEGDSVRGSVHLATAGYLGDAAAVLTQLINHPEPQMAYPARRELASTLLALGQDTLAHALWDFRGASRSQLIATAEWAVSWGNYPTANDLYTALAEQDSIDPSLYLSRARAYQLLRPDDALRSTATGLRYAPRNTELRTLHLWLLAQNGETRAADSLFRRLSASETSRWQAQSAQLIQRIQAADTTGANAFTNELIRRYPYRREVLDQVLDRWVVVGRFDDGLAEVQRVLRVNPRSSDLWRTYARFAEGAHFMDLAQYAVQQALRLAPSDQAKARVAEEFAPLLARPTVPLPTDLPPDWALPLGDQR